MTRDEGGDSGRGGNNGRGGRCEPHGQGWEEWEGGDSHGLHR